MPMSRSRRKVIRAAGMILFFFSLPVLSAQVWELPPMERLVFQDPQQPPLVPPPTPPDSDTPPEPLPPPVYFVTLLQGDQLEPDRKTKMTEDLIEGIRGELSDPNRAKFEKKAFQDVEDCQPAANCEVLKVYEEREEKRITHSAQTRLPLGPLPVEGHTNKLDPYSCTFGTDMTIKDCQVLALRWFSKKLKSHDRTFHKVNP